MVPLPVPPVRVSLPSPPVRVSSKSVPSPPLMVSLWMSGVPGGSLTGVGAVAAGDGALAAVVGWADEAVVAGATGDAVDHQLREHEHAANVRTGLKYRKRNRPMRGQRREVHPHRQPRGMHVRVPQPHGPSPSGGQKDLHRAQRTFVPTPLTYSCLFPATTQAIRSTA
jgi:hypothetical protein